MAKKKASTPPRSRSTKKNASSNARKGNAKYSVSKANKSPSETPSKSISRSRKKAAPKSLDSSSECNQPPTIAMRPPEWLSQKPIACNKWHELLGELKQRRLLASIDLDLFALYCDAWQEFSNAAQLCDEEGMTFTTDKGYVAIHPAKLLRDKASETIQRLADRLGIGVNKRRGLNVIEPSSDDDDASGDEVEAYAAKKPRPKY